MPIVFEPISNKKIWSGFGWKIDDDDLLAELIAKVALGQYRHVLRILEQTDCQEAAPAPTAFSGARSLLSVSGEDPWHRDGWMFQIISWIAAHCLRDGKVIAPPHMQHAHKGFDGLHLVVNPDSDKVEMVVICEDKATGNPRKMVKKEVWPEFASLEEGERGNLLLAKVTSLLETQSGIDPDEAVDKIFWEKARAYRVAITVGKTHGNEKGHNRLFKDYDLMVTGNVSRRRAETLYLDDLRGWMQSVADKAISILEDMETDDV